MADPQAEAQDKLGGDYEARVLEPSPPAVGGDHPDHPYTDDPVVPEPGDVPEGRKVVAPVSHRGNLTWEDIVESEPDLAPWCAERWLAAWKRLEPLPAGFKETRLALHKVAEGVVAPARKPDNEIALRFTRGGFGTPFYEEDGADCQARVQHGELIRQRGNSEESEPLPGVDEAAATALGDFYGFACSVLEELRAEEAADGDTSMVQLWPEHFDIAFDLGSEAKGTRVTLGASPGDDEHDEPYLYVLPWNKEISGELWNATAFVGAELPYSELVVADDQRQAAIRFMAERYRALPEG